MKNKALSLSTILGFLGVLLMIHSMSSQAATGTVECQTAFGEKSFTIQEHAISFRKEDVAGVSRSISSVQKESVRTQNKHKGFIKTLYLDGNKYQISIQDTSEFSDVNDYLSITSPKGHRMTYPLTCRSV